MVNIKIKVKIVILSIIISILMYPRTIEILIKNANDISTARKLNSTPLQRNKAPMDPAKSRIVFIFDGGWTSVYSEAYEPMKVYGYKGSVSIIPSRISSKEFMSYQQLSDLYLQGWDLLNQSYSHKENVYNNTDLLLSDFDKARQWMKNRYIGRLSDMLVMPYGEINPYLIAQLKAAGYRNVRTSENLIILDKAKIEYYPVVVINLLADKTAEEVEGLLANLANGPKVFIIILNKLGDKGNDSEMIYSKDKFEEILMFIDQNRDKFDVITYSQLFE